MQPVILEEKSRDGWGSTTRSKVHVRSAATLAGPPHEAIPVSKFGIRRFCSSAWTRWSQAQASPDTGSRIVFGTGGRYLSEDYGRTVL